MAYVVSVFERIHVDPYYNRTTNTILVRNRNIYAYTLHSNDLTVTAVAIWQGPVHGLQLTFNVQQYENLPFSDQDSGIKASIYMYFVIYDTAADDH